MSESDRPKPPASPFERKPIQWGRMPPATFRVPASPPDPSATQSPVTPVQQRQAYSQFQARPSLAPQRAPRPPRPEASILGGSLIPQAPRPTPALHLTPTPAPQPQPTPAPLPPADTPADLSVRPLPPVDPVFDTAPLAEASEPIAPADPAPAPLAEVAPVAATPPVVEDAVLNDIHVVAPRAARKPNRIPWVLGGSLIVLAAVAGGALWMLNNRPAPPPPVQPQQPITAAVPALPAEATVEPAPLETLDAAAPETITPPVPAATQPTARAPAVVPAPRPTPPVTAQPTPQPATPAPAPAAEAPPPVVVVTPPPTAAAPTQSDPDAPIVTRPQPLD